jgi:hypothetical protein
VLSDPQLEAQTRQLLRTLRDWRRGHAEALACEEALVQACGCCCALDASRAGRHGGWPCESRALAATCSRPTLRNSPGWRA